MMVFSMKSVSTLLLATAVLLASAEGFATTTTTTISSKYSSRSRSAAASSHSQLFAEKKEGGGGFFGAIGNMFEELDAFMDDATARRLGNGAAYYGKRKSSFYGKDDSMKKADKDVADSEEDFMVQSGGNYKWITDENGQLRPVSRMKNSSVEKPESAWGRKEKKSEEVE